MVVPTTAVRALAKPSRQQARHHQKQQSGQETRQERGSAFHAVQQLEVVFPDIMEINAELRSKLESLERELAGIREQGLNQETDVGHKL